MLLDRLAQLPGDIACPARPPTGALPDMMIAAHALATGAVLVTNNTRHFARLAPPLEIADWGDG